MEIEKFIQEHLNKETGYVEVLPIELMAIYESGYLTKEHSNNNNNKPQN